MKLAEIFKEKGKFVFDYKGDIKFSKPPEENYMTNNPNRRCPNINLARKILDYEPIVSVEDGVELFLKYLAEN